MTLRMSLVVVALGVFTAWAQAGPGERGQPASKSELVRVVYPVAELVVPFQDHWPFGPEKSAAKTLENELIELIRSTVCVNTWKETGGEGTLQYHPLGMALVVHQTAEVQAEIRDLLSALRRLQEVEAAVEMRIVSLSADMAAEFRAKAGFKEETPLEGEATPVARITDKELYLWLRILQGDSETNIMQAPKIVVANGQGAGVTVGQTMPLVTEYRVVPQQDQVALKPHIENVHVGLRCGLLPTVSADRRDVRLKIDFRQTSLDGPVAEMPVAIRAGRKGGSQAEIQAGLQQAKLRTLKFQQTCRIPDGQTIAVSLGTTMVETRTEMGPSVLKDIPVLRRVFVTVGVGHEEREVFLLITPRIIVNEAEEQPVLTEIPAVPRR